MLKTIINFILVKIFNKKPEYKHCGNCIYKHLDSNEPPCNNCCEYLHSVKANRTPKNWVWNGKVI